MSIRSDLSSYFPVHSRGSEDFQLQNKIDKFNFFYQTLGPLHIQFQTVP